MTSLCSVLSVFDKRISRYPICFVDEEEFMVHLRLVFSSADNPEIEHLPGEIIRQIAVQQLMCALTRVKSAAAFNLAVKRGTLNMYSSTDIETGLGPIYKAQPETCDVGPKASASLLQGLTKLGNFDQISLEGVRETDESGKLGEMSTCAVDKRQEVQSVKQAQYTCCLCDTVFSKLSSFKQHKLDHAATLSHFGTTTVGLGQEHQLDTKMETDFDLSEDRNEPKLIEVRVKMDDTGIEDHEPSTEESETESSPVIEQSTTKSSPKDAKEIIPTHSMATPEKEEKPLRLAPHIMPPGTPVESPVRKKKGAYVCTFCPRRFSTIPTLQSHLSKHTDKQFAEMTFKCSICGEVYFRESDLKKHCCPVKLNSRRFPCDVCDKSYFCQFELAVHSRSHSGEKPFVCEHCGKCCVSKAVLKTHRRVHTGEKPFLCSTCGKAFSSKQGAQHHEIKHSSVKAHVCDTCGKSYHLEKHLRIHKLVHNDVKPHMCEECGRSFLHRRNLTEHLRIHAGVKPYVCQYCGWKFTKEYPLSYHIKSKHKDKLGS